MRILIIKCGGTITMEKKDGGSLVSSFKINQDLDFFVEKELQNIPGVSSIQAEEVTFLDSSNLGAKVWQKLTTLIVEKKDFFSGFLITFGTNTLAYASSALSFSLMQYNVKVVFTGSQIPFGECPSDAGINLINSVRVLCDPKLVFGVYVVFGSKVILGSRAKKTSESALDAYSAYNCPLVASIGIDVFFEKVSLHRTVSKKIMLDGEFDSDIVSLTLTPSLSLKFIDAIIDKGVQGLVLRGYGTGDISNDLFPSLRKARERKIPVVVTTQCPNSKTMLGLNNVGSQALDLGVIPAYDMSMEAMTTKLMILLANGIVYEDIDKLMRVNLSGELSFDIGEG